MSYLRTPEQQRRLAAACDADMAKAREMMGDDREAMEAARLVIVEDAGGPPTLPPMTKPGDAMTAYLFADGVTALTCEDASETGVESLKAWASPAEAMAAHYSYPEGTRLLRVRIVVEEVVRGPDAIDRWATIGGEGRWRAATARYSAANATSEGDLPPIAAGQTVADEG